MAAGSPKLRTLSRPRRVFPAFLFHPPLYQSWCVFPPDFLRFREFRIDFFFLATNNICFDKIYISSLLFLYFFFFFWKISIFFLDTQFPQIYFVSIISNLINNRILFSFPFLKFSKKSFEIYSDFYRYFLTTLTLLHIFIQIDLSKITSNYATCHFLVRSSLTHFLPSSFFFSFPLLSSIRSLEQSGDRWWSTLIVIDSCSNRDTQPAGTWKLIIRDTDGN